MLSIDRSTEPFIRIVIRIRHLYELHFRTTTDTTECQTVDLLVGFQRIASKFNTDIFQLTRAFTIKFIGGRVTIFRSGSTLDNRSFCLVYTSITADNQTSPVSRRTLARFFIGSKDDRFVNRTFSHDLRTRFDNQRGSLFTGRNRYTLDDRSSFNCQRSTRFYIDKAFHIVLISSIQRKIGCYLSLQDHFFGRRSIIRNSHSTSCRLIAIFCRSGDRSSTLGNPCHLTGIYCCHLFIGGTPCYRFIRCIVRSNGGRQCHGLANLDSCSRRTYGNSRYSYRAIRLVIITTRYSSKHNGQRTYRGQTFQ